MPAEGLTVCDQCNGSGMVAVGKWGARPPREKCNRCDGTGLVPNNQQEESMAEHTMKPYPGMGSGHAVGSDTSRERQQANDASGVTAAAQLDALALLRQAGAEGMTAAEYEDLAGIGHGMASSALSHLHRAGMVARVKMRRKRHEIYVLPGHVNGREESPYRPRLKPAKHPRDYTEQQVREAALEAGWRASDRQVELTMKIMEHLK